METARQDKRSPLKDRPLRFPGQSLDSEIRKLQIEIVGYFILAVFLIFVAYSQWVSWYFHAPPQPLIFFVLALIFIAYGCYRVYQIQKRIKNMKLGRDGERHVGQALETLREKGFTVFHDLIGKNFNVDHVIVSPHGVFAVETKTISKPVRGNLQSLPMARVL